MQDTTTNPEQQSSCLLCDKWGHEFIIECSECKNWIYYECTKLHLHKVGSIAKRRRKYSWINCISINEILKNYLPQYRQTLDKLDHQKNTHILKNKTNERKTNEMKIELQTTDNNINKLLEITKITRPDNIKLAYTTTSSQEQKI